MYQETHFSKSVIEFQSPCAVAHVRAWRQNTGAKIWGGSSLCSLRHFWVLKSHQ